MRALLNSVKPTETKADKNKYFKYTNDYQIVESDLQTKPVIKTCFDIYLTVNRN